MTGQGLIHVDLTNSIGALQIGNLISIFLFGILTLQTFTYYNAFRDDRWTYKWLVACVWLLEVGQTVVVSFQVYRATITLYGLPQLLIKLPGLGLVTALGGSITLLVQGFFAWRLFTVLPGVYRYIGPFCIFVSWLRCGGSLALTIEAILSPTVKGFIIQWSWLISVLLAVGAVLDVIIALSTIYYLQKQREIGHQRLATVVERLILFTIRTGLLTSVSAVFVLITFQSLPNNLIWVALYTSLAKLYSNSLLSALNARQEMREEVSPASQALPSQMSILNPPSRITQGHVRLESLPVSRFSTDVKTPTEKTLDISGTPIFNIYNPRRDIPSPEISYQRPRAYGYR